MLCAAYAPPLQIRGAKALSNMDAARQVAGGAGMLRPRVNNTPGGSKGFEYMPASPSQYAIGPNSQNGPRGGYGAGPGGPAAGGGGFRPPPPRMAGGPQPGSYSGAAQHAHTASALVGKTVKVWIVMLAHTHTHTHRHTRARARTHSPARTHSA